MMHISLLNFFLFSVGIATIFTALGIQIGLGLINIPIDLKVVRRVFIWRIILFVFGASMLIASIIYHLGGGGIIEENKQIKICMQSESCG